MKRVFALVISALLLVGCGADPSKNNSALLTAGLTYVPDIQFAPFYVAQEKGFFADENLDVEIRHHGQSETLFGAIQSGTENVVFAGGAEMIQARSEGVEIVNFATIYQHYPVVVIVPEASEIQTIQDLRGKRVGLPGEFGENWFGLLKMLQEADMTRDDIEITSIGYTAQAALPQGHVDAIIGFSNNDYVRFLNSDFPVRAIPLMDGEVPLVSVGLGTMQHTLENDKPTIEALRRAIIRAINDIKADPAGAVELSAKYVPNLTTPEAKQAALVTLNATIKLYGEGDEIASQVPENWVSTANLLDEIGMLSAEVDVHDVFITLK